MSEEVHQVDKVQEAKLHLDEILAKLIETSKTVRENENGGWTRWRKRKLEDYGDNALMALTPEEGHYLELKPLWTTLNRLGRAGINTISELGGLQVLPDEVTRNLNQESADILGALRAIAVAKLETESVDIQ